MTEDTAKRIAVALERIADRLDRQTQVPSAGRAGGSARARFSVPAMLMPGERVFSVPNGAVEVSVQPWGAGGGGAGMGD